MYTYTQIHAHTYTRIDAHTQYSCMSDARRCIDTCASRGVSIDASMRVRHTHILGVCI